MTRLEAPPSTTGSFSSLGFPPVSLGLETFGLKFSPGDAHISRTMMLAELDAVLANVPQGSGAAAYREAILQADVLGKTTDSTRQGVVHKLRGHPNRGSYQHQARRPARRGAPPSSRECQK